MKKKPQRVNKESDLKSSAADSNDEKAFFGLDLNTYARMDLLEQLQRAHYLEEFLAERYPNAKTFGLAGSESLIPGLSALFARCSELGISHIDLGMAHRGRLNVLMNILGKSMGTVCTEFNEVIKDDSDDAKLRQLQLGDVKYHLGASGKCSFNTLVEHHANLLKFLLSPIHLIWSTLCPLLLGKFAQNSII